MVTIEDVAREAGVSISTVSYALSGKRAISEETRRRVVAAAERLGYMPKAAARALAGKRTHVIAVTTPLHADTDHSAHMAFAMAVTTAAREHDFDTLLLVQDDELEGMRRTAATLLADGIVVLDVAADDARAELARQLRCPVVFVGVPTDNEGLTCIDLDFERATEEAVEALRAAGHRSLALVSQGQDVIDRASNYPLRIERTFVAAAERHGLEARIVRPRPDTSTGVVEALLDEHPDVTGLVLSTRSEVADAVGPALERRGLRVPEDMSVVAVGMTPEPGRQPLPFDSFPLDPQLTCPAAVDLLVGIIEGRAVPGGVRLVPPVHQVRGSVAPVRTRDVR